MKIKWVKELPLWGDGVREVIDLKLLNISCKIKYVKQNG